MFACTCPQDIERTLVSDTHDNETQAPIEETEPQASERPRHLAPSCPWPRTGDDSLADEGVAAPREATPSADASAGTPEERIPDFGDASAKAKTPEGPAEDGIGPQGFYAPSLRYEEYAQDARSIWERLPHWFHASLAAVGLACVLSLLILTRGFGLFAAPELVNVVWESEDEARASLEDLGYVVVVEEQPTEVEGDVGRVIATKPKAGSRVAKGANVVIKVGRSSGETKTIPDLHGLGEQEALDVIASSNWFVKDDITHAHSDSVPEGCVISQGPAAGSQKTKGSKIDLVISDGPNPNAGTMAADEGNEREAVTTLTVPDVAGMPIKDAQDLLEGMGLQVFRGEDVISDELTNGTVRGVEPGIGATVTPGDTVTVHVVAPPKDVG